MIISSLSAVDIFNYSQSTHIRPELKISEAVTKPEENVQLQNTLPDEKEAYSSRETLPTKDVLDFAIEALDVDKSLIGVDSDIKMFRRQFQICSRIVSYIGINIL